MPAADFPAGQADVDKAGLYAWHADEKGRAQLSTAFELELPALIYAGQAGATSSKAGIERASTLSSRISGNHLKGNLRSSTFRRTLSASLFEVLDLRLEAPKKLDAASNAAITAWMHEHLRLATHAVVDRASLASLEHEVLLKLDPPLNLMGMPITSTRRELRALRRNLG